MSRFDPEPVEATRQTIWQALESSVARFRDRPALLADPNVSVTYGEMLEQVDKLAAGLLAAGVRRGDHVAIFFPPILEWAYVHYALTTLGAIVVPVNINYKTEEVRWVLKQGDVSAIITLDTYRSFDFVGLLESVDPALKPGEVETAQFPLLKRIFVLNSQQEQGGPYSLRTLLAHEPSTDERAQLEKTRSDLAPADPCYIIFTSGSTARPKSALIPHRAVCGVGYYYGRAMKMTPEDRFVAALTTFHVAGLIPGIPMVHTHGGATCLAGMFDPGIWLQTVERHRCTAGGGFDTLMNKIMAHPDFKTRDISCFKKIHIGCTPSYYLELERAFNSDVIAMAYGCTEAGGIVAIVPPDETDLEIRRASNGYPLPGVEVKVVDHETGEPVPVGTPGELCFRGWNRLLEYYNMPEETAESIDAEGFIHMGDYGWMDERGLVYYRGRYKMMVKTGGENVSQREVEIFLEENVPSVEFAQVVGVPDDLWGEAVVSFVQLRAGVEATPEQIREQCRGKIAGFKIPKHVFVLMPKEWPMMTVGRPDKGALKQMAMERLGRK
ncbi:MAG: hypothetical protein EPO21_03045 [Chloroflexota bacterium]|nr:MAG: hypothetical protein EPO21_03045 [Chloroflexota bacterium]